MKGTMMVQSSGQQTQHDTQQDKGVTLQHIEQTIRGVGNDLGGSIVSIGRDGRGSGFVIGADRVLTSAHNLRDATVSVTFADSRNEQGVVHGVDVDGDLAVINVPTGEAASLEFASVASELGTAVIALSRGGHRSRATLGFVSGRDHSFRGPRGRIVRGSLEHTAPLARGSSGGPVVNTNGEVVGVNTHRIGDGFYLARAADDVLRARLADLLEGRSPTRRTIGIAIAPPEVAARLRKAVGLAERAGLLVRGLDDAGPAARAGVLVGDLVVSAGGTATTSIDELQSVLEALAADTIELGVVRGADELTITVSFVTPA
jgi:serine protease Do